MDQPLSPTMPAEPEDGDLPGRGATIGRFLVLGVLGGGGMGVVLSAYDPQLDRKVALKLLRGDVTLGAGSTGRREALLREAQVMARLSHPNVVPVHEVGFLDDAAYIVMEQVEGRTLRAWCAEPGRGWREILDVLRAAGEGLAAAHREGVVHRDVKPDNVLVGADGRPRVSDFGLSALEVAAGAAAGTRGYMAPEQTAGRADARSDQYAYCVMAWELLHGVLPAADVKPFADGKCPTWVDDALARGLRRDPDERWPSMDELLAALRPRSSRRRLGAAVAAALTVGAVAFALGQSRVPSVAPCAGAEAQIAPLWDDAAQRGVAAAFHHSGHADPDASFRRVDAALRGRLAAWARAHRGACEATHVRHEQSDSLLDLRMRCLANARVDLATLIAQLGHVDAAAVDRAQYAAGDSGDLAACGDAAALTGLVPAPRDPAKARAVEALRIELARLAALGTLGKWKEQIAAAPAVVARAREVGYAPLLARALFYQGRGSVGSGDVDAGIAALYEAVRLASVAHDDALTTQALSELMFALGSRKQRFEAADAIYQVAIAAAARAGNAPRVLRTLFNYRGHVLSREGDDRAALFLRLNVLALTVADSGPASGNTGMSLAYIADAIRRNGRARDALPVFDRALAILEGALGREHPFVTAQQTNLAGTLMSLWEWDRASQLLEQILAVEVRTLGPDSRGVGELYSKLGEVRYEQWRLAEATAFAERARPILAQHTGPRHADVADVELLLGAIAARDGRPADAHARFATALAMYREAVGPEHFKVAGALVEDADALLALGQTAKAREAIDAAIAIDKKTVGEEHPDHGLTLIVAARIDLADKQVARAEARARRALALLESEQGPDSPALVDGLVVLCAAQAGAGDAQGAEQTGARAERLAAGRPREVRERARRCARRLAQR